MADPKPRKHSFPCQQCGAHLDYLPGTGELGCSHCGHRHRITVSRQPIIEYDYHSALDPREPESPGLSVYSVDCDTCGAEFDFDARLHADQCPFCGTRVVVDPSEHRIITPESLLPFNITADQATAAFKKWLGRLWFAPGKLKKYARQNRRLNGVYVPYWTYDCSTASRYTGQRGDLYQVPRQVSVMVNGKRVMRTRMVTKVRWRPASGRVSRNFDDLLIYASNTLPRSIARDLSPWDLQALTPYQEEFLSGFQSEVYNLELDGGFDIARERMKPVIHQDIRRDIGGDRQRISNVDTGFSNIRYKHVLLPFWVAGFRFHNRTYQFIVNGRSGEVQGQRPYSRIKIALASMLLIGAAIGFIYLASQPQ